MPPLLNEGSDLLNEGALNTKRMRSSLSTLSKESQDMKDMKDMRDSKEKVKFDIKNIESKVLK